DPAASANDTSRSASARLETNPRSGELHARWAAKRRLGMAPHCVGAKAEESAPSPPGDAGSGRDPTRGALEHGFRESANAERARRSAFTLSAVAFFPPSLTLPPCPRPILAVSTSASVSDVSDVSDS